MNKSKIKTLFLLHIMLMIYSMSGICSKMASKQEFLSTEFCFYYAMIIILLGFYAIGWQQIIKRLPLMMAFANKAVTIVWGIIWGALIFGEKVTWNMIAGAAIIFAGIYLVTGEDSEKGGEH